jgi:peptidoglycan/LPS O-acetylase OafA/YrhL
VSAARDVERIDQLDGVRAFAFAAVFAFHVVHLPFGFLGVDVFFVLSGFLITRNLLALRDRATTGSAFAVFFYRRVLRIVPPYYLALAVMLALEPFPLAETPWYLGFASNIRDTIQPVLEGPMVTLWSIAVEEQFYILWPFLVLLLPRRALAPAFVLAIAGAALFRFAASGNDDAVYRLMPSRMDLLAAGALLALADTRDATWLPRRVGWFAVAGALALGAFAALAMRLPSFRYNHADALYDVLGYALIGVACVALLAIVRCARRGPLHALLVWPPIAYVGKVSYVAYLVHVVALDVVHRRALPGAIAAALAFALTIGFASLSWYALEQPISRALRDRVRVRPRGDS